MYRASMKTIDRKRAAATRTTHLACTHFSHWLCSVYWNKTVPKQAAWITLQQHTLQIPVFCLSECSPEGKAERTESKCAYCWAGTFRNYQIYCTHADLDHLRAKQLYHVICFSFHAARKRKENWKHNLKHKIKIKKLKGCIKFTKL